jgi:hypothetical protein
MQYDDLYRVKRVDYSGDEDWASPYEAESGDATGTRTQPSPHVSFAKRVSWQTFAYDAVGNTTATADDAGGFFDRSLGAITTGAASAGPHTHPPYSDTPRKPSSSGELGVPGYDIGVQTRVLPFDAHARGYRSFQVARFVFLRATTGASGRRTSCGSPYDGYYSSHVGRASMFRATEAWAGAGGGAAATPLRER